MCDLPNEFRLGELSPNTLVSTMHFFQSTEGYGYLALIKTAESYMAVAELNPRPEVSWTVYCDFILLKNIGINSGMTLF